MRGRAVQLRIGESSAVEQSAEQAESFLGRARQRRAPSAEPGAEVAPSALDLESAEQEPVQRDFRTIVEAHRNETRPRSH
jgi:hypothetical protein